MLMAGVVLTQIQTGDDNITEHQTSSVEFQHGIEAHCHEGSSSQNTRKETGFTPLPEISEARSSCFR